MGQSIVRALNQNVTGFKREHYSLLQKVLLPPNLGNFWAAALV